MKCQKCGKNDVNFHFTSNINGTVTQAHLCAKCAADAGYDVGSMFGGGMFDVGSMFGGSNQAGRFFPVFGSGSMFTQPQPMWQTVVPVFRRPSAVGTVKSREHACKSDCTCDSMYADSGTEAVTGEVDEEMKKRREVNVLREQMRKAALADDFEKAIELRERLKDYEI